MYWRKFLYSLVPLLFLFLAATQGGQAQAKVGVPLKVVQLQQVTHTQKVLQPLGAKRPAIINNQSITIWSGGMQGATTTTTLSNPGMGTGYWWDRVLKIATSNFSTILAIGFVKIGDNSQPLYCNGSSPGLYVFETNQYGNDSCQAIGGNSSEINHDYDITIVDVNSGLVEFYTASAYGPTPCSTGCSLYFTVPAWYYVQMAEDIYSASWSGHLVWGSHWINNYYMSMSGNWSRQQIPSPTCGGGNDYGCPFAANPPQMYWNVYPSQDTTGGELYSCEYSSGTTCNFGSTPAVPANPTIGITVTPSPLPPTPTPTPLPPTPTPTPLPPTPTSTAVLR